jgi:adenine-specific DNA-methyltransferase
MATGIPDFKDFPTTRYQGSKRKILSWIYDTFKELEFDTALDAFGGSASVSYLLKVMDKTVTYNDKLHFNYQIGKAIIENSTHSLTPEDITSLTTQSSNIQYSDFIERTFRQVYYRDKENSWLDTVTSNIVQMNHYQPDVLEYKKALAYYALFQASLIKRPFNLFHRKNLNIRTRRVERNFGNKTTWEKPFDETFTGFITEVNDLVFDTGKACKAINQSIFDVDPIGYDLVYMDPPYLTQDGANETANYVKCYHFLEGLSKYQAWTDIVDLESSNYRLKSDYLPNDFNASNVIEKFEELLLKFQNSTIVFSYKFGGKPSIDTIIRLMKKIKGNAHKVSKHYKYALNNQNGDAKLNREVLIIGI